MKQEKYPKLKKPQEILAIEGIVSKEDIVLRFSDGSLYLKHRDGHITKVPK